MKKRINKKTLGIVVSALLLVATVICVFNGTRDNDTPHTTAVVPHKETTIVVATEEVPTTEVSTEATTETVETTTETPETDAVSDDEVLDTVPNTTPSTEKVEGSAHAINITYNVVNDGEKVEAKPSTGTYKEVEAEVTYIPTRPVAPTTAPSTPKAVTNVTLPVANNAATESTQVVQTPTVDAGEVSDELNDLF